jgi:hypothetical protein
VFGAAIVLIFKRVYNTVFVTLFGRQLFPSIYDTNDVSTFEMAEFFRKIYTLL